MKLGSPTVQPSATRAPLTILAVGDTYMPSRYFRDALAALDGGHVVRFLDVAEAPPPTAPTASDRSLREYQGSPSALAARMDGVDVLVVHGAPVTEAVLDASVALKLVCCARGGPVNIDVEAVTERGLPLVTAPGRNAEAVADLTLAFLVMLARGIPIAQRFLDGGGRLKDNWEGARFIGSDLRGHALGLVGFGNVGHRVALRARAFGVRVLAFDPYVRAAPDGVEWVDDLDELLALADFVSLHARATRENANLFDAARFARMKPGACFVNTARESLVDEQALDAALASGHLAGAALDVVHTSTATGRHPLLRHENVVMTPHIGGATRETLAQGAEIVVGEIARFAAGEPLVNVVNAVGAPR
jgi:D-3-phosphoglycerate dehydrogenase / 2-oxoglutarate reductase